MASVTHRKQEIEEVLNYVYCEWIDGERMQRSLPGARYVSEAELEGFRLAFVNYVETQTGSSGDGGCHLLPAEGSSVPGILYELDDATQAEADRLCRIEEGRYRRMAVDVRDPSGALQAAITYVIAEPGTESAPSVEYVEHMVAGATERGFAADYVRSLKDMLGHRGS